MSTKRPFSFADKLVFLWLIIDLLVHTILEGSFVYLSFATTIAKSDHWLAIPWKEYGKADTKWLGFDPCVLSVELLTCTIDSVLCVIILYAMLKDKPYRHFFQIVLCTCELYGDWMTFVPSIMEGYSNLDISNPKHLWLYLVGSNGVWVVVPLLLLWQSFNYYNNLSKANQVNKKQN